MAAQKMTTPFGLLGRKLGHSWSRPIHEQLGSAPYSHVELEPDEVAGFIANEAWRGLNVTIPYKAQAAASADEKSPRVERLGVANTLVRRPDGTIYAENTDVLGFSWMLDRFCTRELAGPAAHVLDGKKALVLGSGGAAQAVVAALEDAGANVTVISRSGEDNYGNLLQKHSDAALIVNTTPVGMYPNCPASPLTDEQLGGMHRLLGVLDVVYNPRKTGICLAAERMGLPSESGLAMLVAQAFFASELFQGRELDRSLIEKIERGIASQTQNIVLIGMPGAGKTSTGKRLSRALGRPFVDIDDAIAEEEGRTSAQIIEVEGENAFRDVETRVTGEFAKKSGLVIACGGGVVTRERNRDLLRQNSSIVMIDRALDELSSKGRPMSKSKGVEKLAQERMGAYLDWSDVHIRCTGSAEGDAALIMEKLGITPPNRSV